MMKKNKHQTIPVEFSIFIFFVTACFHQDQTIHAFQVVCYVFFY